MSVTVDVDYAKIEALLINKSDADPFETAEAIGIFWNDDMRRRWDREYARCNLCGDWTQRPMFQFMAILCGPCNLA